MIKALTNVQPKYHAAFCAQRKPSDNKNPISKAGERSTLFKATVIAGIGFGARALFWLLDDGFLLDSALEAGAKITEKNNKNINGIKKQLLSLGAGAAILLGIVGLFAMLYSIFQAPKVMYKGKINAFTKGKDMDIYIKSNDTEKSLYDQINEKAKNATPEEKMLLKQQYLKLKAAKNQLPAFADIQRKN